jgi:hypothetical protein
LRFYKFVVIANFYVAILSAQVIKECSYVRKLDVNHFSFVLPMPNRMKNEIGAKVEAFFRTKAGFSGQGLIRGKMKPTARQFSVNAVGLDFIVIGITSPKHQLNSEWADEQPTHDRPKQIEKKGTHERISLRRGVRQTVQEGVVSRGLGGSADLL